MEEPNELPIPQEVTEDEQIQMQKNQPPAATPERLLYPTGYPGETVTLPELFEFRGENIDFQADARTEPAVFSPLCSFSGTLVLRGGGCKLAFGWYNAVASGGAPPAADEIYPLIPADDPAVYGCGAFCPLAIAGAWTLKTFTADDIRSDPNYADGEIGFALVGNPDDANCKQTHYSQQELNTVCTNCSPNAPWITTLVYQSTAVPDAFYMGFEDLPMDPDSFEGSGAYKNDGDFNDFVFFITGLSCEGGGEPCDTGLKGACAVGRTDCSSEGGEPNCRQVIQGSDEKCDNVDNDCNGEVDDGDLCGAGLVCDRGSCVAECGTGEFRCPDAFVCESGFCIDPLCKGVACEEGEACRAGDCVGVCEGVFCPLAQECQLGRCVDLCKGVTCGEGQVCERGICISSCDCRDCGEGKACGAQGACVDTGCEAVTCDAGQVCVAGTCTDACTNAVCPGGATCAAGECGDAIPGAGASGGSGGSGGGIVIDPGSGSTSASGGSGSGSGSAGNGSAPVGRRVQEEPGCACRVGTASGSAPYAGLALLGFGLALGLRRRRSR